MTKLHTKRGRAEDRETVAGGQREVGHEMQKTFSVRRDVREGIQGTGDSNTVEDQRADRDAGNGAAGR
jgi:hypothetical protein